MAPSILIVGATGNTGRGAAHDLPGLLQATQRFSKHRVLALTRNIDSPVAQQLAQILGHQVERAFIAAHNEPNQFAEESAFHVAALDAGVEYVVRISTTAAAVRPDFRSYYPRAHWAIEAMLGSTEFGALKWTSLQPNAFSTGYLAPAAQHIKHYKRTGEQPPLSLMMAKDAPVAPNDPSEVGAFAARLLALDDPSPHNRAKYVLNGPEDITGEQMVHLIEQHIGTKVDNVVYQDISFIDGLVASGFGGPGQSKTVMASIKYGLMTMWEGSCNAATTSKEVKELGPPKRTPSDVLETLLDDQN
ncbi:hypothetical protein D0863_07339 [Hortaea werneckii]|uniref:NmrA-like domain-containing protein n=1 Tax=Hortaea werneckii TaxID=91943 RepID=A0A3M7DVD5_HORWE|nr:hypothetical protein D0863_07339 [Hortaea werneckii]